MGEFEEWCRNNAIADGPCSDAARLAWKAALEHAARICAAEGERLNAMTCYDHRDVAAQAMELADIIRKEIGA